MATDRTRPPIPRGAEVSIGLPQALVRWVEDLGFDPERLVEGSGMAVADVAARTEGLPWASFARICENALELCGEHGLVRLGETFFETSIGQQLAAATRDFDTPAEFYRWLGQSSHHRAITCIEQRLIEHDASHSSFVMLMERGYAPSRAYALLRSGFLAAVPRSYDEPDARTSVVEIRGGFRVDIERVAARPWARAVTAYRRWRSSPGAPRLSPGTSIAASPSAVIDEMQRLHEASQRRLVELEERNESLARSQRRFNAAFDLAPMIMLITEPSEGRMVDVNARFCELSGFTAEEAIGKRATELGLWPDLRERDENRALRKSRGGFLDGVEVRVCDRNGRELTLMVSTQPIIFDEVEYLLWQAVDITARKRAEQQLAELRRHFEELAADRGIKLEQSEEKLRQSERLASIGTLAAGIAHQINNPIGSIRAAAEFGLLAARSPQAGENQLEILVESLETAVEQSQRAGEIVRGILQFARGRTLPRHPGDVVAVVQSAIEQCADYAESRGAVVVLGGDRAPAWVSMSRMELEQVFVNLLRNAIESGDDKVQVHVRIASDADSVRVEVQDDGRGIAPDSLPYVFDPFHTTRLDQGGTGLGLSIAHGIVDAHGGKIEAESEPGHGLRMTVDLPLIDPPA